MKVAVLISGQPRYVDKLSYKIIKKYLLDKYDCDVYCHCWFDKELIMKTSPWSGHTHFKCNGDELELIRNNYKPAGFEYDTPISSDTIYNFKNIANIATPYNLTSMYTSMKRAYQVFCKYKPINIEYDIFIKLRYDAIPTELPNLYNLPKGFLYFSGQHDAKKHVLANHMIISTDKKSFETIMCMVDNMIECDNDNVIVNDEEVIYHIVNKRKLSYSLLPMSQFRILLPAEVGFKM